MGHQRLGKISKSKAFANVVALVTGPVASSPSSMSTEGGDGGSGVSIVDDVDQIASATLVAARKGLELAINDRGLCETFFLLTQLVLASREDDSWRERFAELGITLADDAGMFEFASGLQYAVQDHFDEIERYSDVAEMARKSAVDAVKKLAGPRAQTLFGSGPDELRDAVRTLSTKKGFAELGRNFFAGILSQFLNFHLCKETPNAVREGRLNGIEGLRDFEETLDRHCYESAKIVQDLCGDWYSKANWREGITRENTARVVAFAIEKLQKELQKQGEGE